MPSSQMLNGFYGVSKIMFQSPKCQQLSLFQLIFCILCFQPLLLLMMWYCCNNYLIKIIVMIQQACFCMCDLNGIDANMFKLFLILYANGIIIFGNTSKELHNYHCIYCQNIVLNENLLSLHLKPK